MLPYPISETWTEGFRGHPHKWRTFLTMNFKWLTAWMKDCWCWTQESSSYCSWIANRQHLAVFHDTQFPLNSNWTLPVSSLEKVLWNNLKTYPEQIGSERERVPPDCQRFEMVFFCGSCDEPPQSCFDFSPSLSLANTYSSNLYVTPLPSTIITRVKLRVLSPLSNSSIWDHQHQPARRRSVILYFLFMLHYF